MNNFYLIRHGQDQENVKGILNGHRDNTLTETGINQAIELSQQIKGLNLDIKVVLSSPLNRSFVTASIVSGINNLPTPIIEPQLIERNFGVMTGKNITDIVSMCSPDIVQGKNITYFLNSPQAESFPDLINRANKLLEKLNQTYDNQNILLSTHGDFGKMLFTAYYQLDWHDTLTSFHFGNSEMLKLSPECQPSESKIITIKQFNA